MKSRNVRMLKILAVTATLTAGSASLGEAFENPFGAPIEVLPETEVMVDAARAFDKIDMNRDGVIDEDEYAAQRVVYAQLARFNRQIAIDGTVTVRVPVPDDIGEQLTSPEKVALDAVARRDYRMRMGDQPGFDRASWEENRLEVFYLSDQNGDGELRGKELHEYAAHYAGQMLSGSAGS
jgi:hypothetical protein